MSFNKIKDFEEKIAEFFGSPYAVAVDCCTHGVELSIRYQMNNEVHLPQISCPKRTYISIPFLANKIGLDLVWRDEDWVDMYYVFPKVIDAAVLWKKNSYIPNTFMCVSFQFRKHLSLGRGGVILCDNEDDYLNLKKTVFITVFFYALFLDVGKLELFDLPHQKNNYNRLYLQSKKSIE